MAILLKAIHRFNTFPLKIPIAFYAEMEVNPQIHMVCQEVPNSQNNFGEKRTKLKDSHFLI